MRFLSTLILSWLLLISCTEEMNSNLEVNIYQTSASGDKLKEIKDIDEKGDIEITINEEEEFQSITGFGGAFTESSAYLLNQMSSEKRNEILKAYFGEEGSNYSLTRTHMNSCDFSLDHYSYAEVEGDTLLTHFTIDHDKEAIIPMIKDAQSISKEGFKVVASPWTAPPWMKDNNDWYGGKLLPRYYPTWALFFSKYAKAYEQEGIPIWAFTVENEPLGNDSHWESMHYTPHEMADFVINHLGPQLKEDKLDINVLIYDQNRGEELNEWAEVLLNDKELEPYIYGTAVHWYTSTVDWFPESLQFTHEQAPNKHIIHTEGCVDAEVPHWKDDQWYWKKEATDWGWDWAKEENKPNHPKYVPTYRYARDIIGCMNNWVEGWIDWNMVLDKQGGPNHAENWCVAPVIVDPETDEVYYTPLYYVLGHFSKFIRPEAKRIGFTCSDDELLLTAVKNIDGSIVMVLLNTAHEEKTLALKLNAKTANVRISGQSVQTIVLNSNNSDL